MDIGLPLWPFKARKVGVSLCYSISEPPRVVQWYQRTSFTSFTVYQFLNPAEISVWMFVCVSLLYRVYVQLDYQVVLTVQRDLNHWSELWSVAFINYRTIDRFFFIYAFICLSTYLFVYLFLHRSLSEVSYFVRGYKTCRVAWQAAYGINSKRLEDVVKCFLNGLVVYENENQYNPVGQRHKTSVAKAWMQLSFSRIGDKMPDTLVINLPSYLDNRILYGYLKDDLTQLGEQVISYSQFCRILNLDFPDVLIPKVS